MTQNTPLPPESLDEIKSNLRQLDIAREQIKLARKAGIDVSQQEQEAESQRNKLNQIKNTYFPGQ